MKNNIWITIQNSKITLAKYGVIIIFLICAMAFGQNHTSTAQTNNKAEVEKWREDLRLLATEMPRRHKNLFHQMTREQFDAAVKKLDERLPSLQRYQVIVEIMRLVAMVGDGHTGLDGNPGFRSYPIMLYDFADGLFVVAADREHAEAVGGRVVKIGQASVEQAMKAVSEIISRDNEMGIKATAPLLLTRPEVLHALGLISDMEQTPYIVERNGRQITVNLKPMPGSALALGFWFSDKPSGWVDMRDNAKTGTPLWLKDPRNNYWFEYLADARAIYVQVNAIQNKNDENIPAFTKRLFDFVNTHEVDRLILDLRWNGGGSNDLNRPWVVGIIKASKIDQPGKLFTVIGRRTFSAAQNLVNDLENFTNTIFVGEPTAANVNMYGDARGLALPNIGIGVRLSSVWWQQMPERDRRRWTAPRLAVEITSEDYRNNSDPVLKAILNYTPKNGLAEQISQAAATRDIPLTTEIIKRIDADPEAAAKAIRDFAADPVNKYVSIERSVDALGNFVVEGNFINSAIKLFKLNVAAFPKSVRAHSSLGAIYARKGDRELAIKSYEKVLELEPSNQAAAEALKRLKGQQ